MCSIPRVVGRFSIIAVTAMLAYANLASHAAAQEALIQRFDKNGNGRIDPDEREAIQKAMAARRGAGRPATPNAKGAPETPPQRTFDRAALIRRFDENNDGRLDEQERAKLVQAMRRGRPAGTPNSNKTPKQADRPGANSASPLDRLPPAAKERFMARFDTNKNGKLDPNELRQARAAMSQMNRMGSNRMGANPGLIPGAPPQPTLNQKELIRQFDANNNGKLDPAELAAAARKTT